MKSINPEEVVAYGATLQTAISMNVKKMDDIIINDICSHNIGIAVGIDDIFDTLIKWNKYTLSNYRQLYNWTWLSISSFDSNI